ncbi:LPD3 domain-containing protein [Alkanindiges illinoisensis]|uniref:LPD3 domain-containing protein n=1 Tax=Alkanindiges illinoisensis TaxID=197183 RepID=UPI0006854D7C|nr:hypothetical protein [Alkanindiges illinoisensis]
MVSKTDKTALNQIDVVANPIAAIDAMIDALKHQQHENYEFLTGEPVASIQSGQIKPDEKGHYIKAAVNWFREWMDKNSHGQEFENVQLGTIIIAPSGIKSAMSHKPHPIDVQALPALPLIIEKAVVLSRTMDDMGKPLENIVVAAPIEIDAKKYYMVVRLRRHTEDKNDRPRFYTQAVTIAEDIKKGHIPSDQVTGQNKLLTQNGGRVRLLNVLYSALSVNNPATSIVTGRTNTVKTPKGTKLDTVFALVEADNVIASHDSTGGTNPKFPQELQPRDRSREASQTWVKKTAANLDPDSLGKTSRADTGAPIVGDDLIVESGNGRTMAIQLAYARGTAEEYRAWLVDEAEYFGFKPEQVEAFKQPVLVRIRKTEIDRAAFAVEANQDDKLSLSATERAKADARRIDDNMAMLFNPSEDGDLLAASNQKFIQAFLQSIGDTEAAQYIGTDGKPTQALVLRIKAAVFSKAYKDDRLLEMVADQTKPDLKNMLNALSVAAPKFIEAQAISRLQTEDLSSQIVDGIESATDQKVIDAIIAAANVVMTAKNDNHDVTEFVKQQGLFGDLPDGVAELAVFLSKNASSAKKMSLLFKAMASFLEKQAIDQSNNSLFGDPEPLSMREVIQHAVGVLEQEYGDKANLSMFDDLGFLEPKLFDQIFKSYARTGEWTPTKYLEQMDALRRIFFANGWGRERRTNGFMIKPCGERKVRLIKYADDDKFFVSIVDLDEKLITEIVGCDNKAIPEIIAEINKYLNEDQQLSLEKSGFDSVDGNDQIAMVPKVDASNTWMNGQIIPWSENPETDFAHSMKLPSSGQLGDKVCFHVWANESKESRVRIDAFIADIKFKTSKVWYGLAMRIADTRFATLIYLPSGTFDILTSHESVDGYDALLTMEEICRHNCLRTDIDKQAHEAATSPYNDLPEPTEAQKISGDYVKGKLSIAGVDIAIENPAGSTRSGVDASGKAWQTTMKHHYGYIENTMGADGDELDVFVKTGLNEYTGIVYVIRQLDPESLDFDEHKIIIGASTLEEAQQIYLSNYESGWQGMGSIETLSIEDFRNRLGKTWTQFDSIGQHVEPITVLNQLIGILQAKKITDQQQLMELREEIRTNEQTARYLMGGRKGLWGRTTNADNKRSAELSNLRLKYQLALNHFIALYSIDKREARTFNLRHGVNSFDSIENDQIHPVFHAIYGHGNHWNSA